MSETPAVKRILVLRDHRLPFVDLDLTDSETGNSSQEICLIGPNGSGKSALLARLHEAITGIPRWIESGEGYCLLRLTLEGEDLYLAKRFGERDGHVFRVSIESSEQWQSLPVNAPSFDELREIFAEHLVLGSSPGFPTGTAFWFDAERHLVDGDSAPELGPFLERLLRAREEAFHQFLRAPENREKTVAEVERDFESSSPHALPVLRDFWSRLLQPLGIRVEFGRTDGPFFNAKGGLIPLERLGHPLRLTLLRTGLFVVREADEFEPILFLDGPEDGLHPELCTKLIPLYRSLAGATPQILVATQSPLIAAGFAPSQRRRLQVGPNDEVTFARGIAPKGASIDEVLRDDFGLAYSTSVPKTTGAPAAARLKRAIRESEDEDELADLIDEVISIRKF